MANAGLTLVLLAAIGSGCVHAQARAQAQAPSQGVSATEVVIGTIQDLSGPRAAFGKQARNGMQLRIDEINDSGGIAGRRLRLLVEDAGFDPRRAVLAAQKLVHQDRIFLLAGHLGAAPNSAAMPVLFEKNIVNFLPITTARAMHEPVHRLKYALAVPDLDQMRQAVPMLARDRGARKVCILHADDDVGLQALRGAEAGLKRIGMRLAAKTSCKRGAADLAPQVAQMKRTGCDMVVLGTGLGETIAAVGASRRAGFNPVFLAGSASYTDLLPRLGGRPMDGLYATMTAQHPYLDDASQALRFWANQYKAKFNEDPTVVSVQGYTIIDLFARAAQQAGTTLTTESFIQAMDTLTVEPDMFGSAPVSFSATRRLGNGLSRLSQIVDGRWKVVGDYPKP